MRQHHPDIVRGDRTIICRLPTMKPRPSRHPRGEHLTDFRGWSCRGIVHRSLLKLPAKEVRFRSRSSLASICGIIVDQTSGLPRPFLHGQFVPRRDCPDVARAAIATPQRTRVFDEGFENPTDRRFIKQEHHARRGPSAKAHNGLSLTHGQPACELGDLPAEPAARIERDTPRTRRPIGRCSSIVLV